MFFNVEKFNNNFELTIFVNLLIYSLILFSVPLIFMGLLSCFKIKINKKATIYMYAFSTGMFLIIGAAGFIKEGYIGLETWFHDSSAIGGYQYTGGNVRIEQSFIAIIVLVTAFLGLGIVILSKYLIAKKSKNVELHKDHAEHGHSDHIISFNDIDNPKAAWVAILMMLSHRIIDGLVLGISVYQLTANGISKANLGLIITFNIHLLLEVVLVYYRQLQYGEKKGKAILFNFITLLLIVPIMFIGAFLGKYINKVGWLMPSWEIFGGVIIVFMAIVELVPEFIHFRNEDRKTIFTTLTLLALGIIITLIMLSFHTHSQVSSSIKFDPNLKILKEDIKLWKRFHF